MTVGTGLRTRSVQADGFGWFSKVPAHWSVLRLKRAAQIINVKRPVALDDRYVGLENIEPWTGRLVQGEDAARAEGIGTCFRAGDVLFGKLRPYLAKAHLAYADGIGSTELLVLREKRIRSEFLRYCLVLLCHKELA
ncbi:restriction endonuclease subunit S domain-containing protein [Falsiroseomonas tokyonensis]|uniref:Type I restriction modification DNA specificity domain-containing protein n=1 Tax=Falsiroseomonas tokyonensis TaxID=430521 RepID=A0ABV7BUZ2_9PROT|nr:hypothetical protein [Falsiroseomonas tokyonensis]MBU8539471.1 hypothetical protein [Falsiroseomonas tokyonensis]